MRFTTRNFVGAISILAMIGAWELLSASNVVSPIFLPSPIQVVKAGIGLAYSGQLLRDLEASLVRVGVGYFLGVVVGILIGVLMGASRSLGYFLEGPIHILRQIPTIAWLPLAILVFGFGNNAAFFLIMYISLWPLLINSYDGLRKIDPSLTRAALNLGASKGNMLFRVYIPALLPQIYSGLWISIGFAFRALIVAELASAVAGPGSGLGYMIMYYSSYLRTDIVIFGMVMFGILGFLSREALVLFQRYFLKWMPPLETEKSQRNNKIVAK